MSLSSESIPFSCPMHHFAQNGLVFHIFACKEGRGASSEAQNGVENTEIYLSSLSELESFCGLMDLPRPAAESSYKCLKTTVDKASASVQKISMQTAAAAEYEQAEQRDGDENRDMFLVMAHG